MVIVVLPTAFLALISLGVMLLVGLLWSIGFWLILGVAVAAAWILGFPLVLLSGIIVGITCIPIPLLVLAIVGIFLMRKRRS